ncbi:MAG TPA: hypothetical protein VIL48_12270 [Acidimicrobiales bacterium]
MDERILAALIGAGATLVAAVIGLWRSSRGGQSATQTINVNAPLRQTHRAEPRRYLAVFLIGVLTTASLFTWALAGGSPSSDGTGAMAERPGESASPPPASAESGPPDGGRRDPAECPPRDRFVAAGARSPEFYYRDLPGDGASLVFQMTIAGSDERLVVSICADGSGGYWYFSRGVQKPTLGLVAPASVVGDGFEADYEFADGPVTYRVEPGGVTVTERGRATDLPVVDVVCVDGERVPDAFAGAGPSCAEATPIPWELGWATMCRGDEALGRGGGCGRGIAGPGVHR